MEKVRLQFAEEYLGGHPDGAWLTGANPLGPCIYCLPITTRR
jgi:hypothetical protein